MDIEKHNPLSLFEERNISSNNRESNLKVDAQNYISNNNTSRNKWLHNPFQSNINQIFNQNDKAWESELPTSKNMKLGEPKPNQQNPTNSNFISFSYDQINNANQEFDFQNIKKEINQQINNINNNIKNQSTLLSKAQEDLDNIRNEQDLLKNQIIQMTQEFQQKQQKYQNQLNSLKNSIEQLQMYNECNACNVIFKNGLSAFIVQCNIKQSIFELLLKYRKQSNDYSDKTFLFNGKILNDPNLTCESVGMNNNSIITVINKN